MKLTMQIRFFMSFIVMYVFCGGISALRAQERTPAQTDSIAIEVDADLKEGKEKILLDKIEILGRVERPQTVFIIPGQDPTVDDIEINRSFFREIFRAVEKGKLYDREKRSTRKKKE